MQVLEPEFEYFDKIEVNKRFHFNSLYVFDIFQPATYQNREKDESNKRNTIKKERLISIELPDGTMLDKKEGAEDKGSEQENIPTEVEERVIPITLDSGKVMQPKFTFLEELKPPTWSVFHKNGKEKEKEVKITHKSNKSESIVKIDQTQKRNSVTGVEISVGN